MLWLARATPALAAPFAQAAVARFSASELARLATITRPTRRAEFIAGHLLLRAALRAWQRADTSSAAGAEREPSIEVAPEGRPYCASAEHLGCGLSLAHSGGWVAALVCNDALPGVDIEVSRASDEVAADGAVKAAAGSVASPVLTTAADAADAATWPLRRPPRAMAADALDRWVAAEARAKSARRDASCWVSRWECAGPDAPGLPAARLHVAVAMSCIPPAVQLVNLHHGSYNSRAIALAWEPATQ